MAAPRFATVHAIETFAEGTRSLALESVGAEPLGFVGGQFIIIDTGQVAESGKAIKRAYSLYSADDQQGQFTLATKRITAGPGSAYMHGLRVGDTIKFSGPWGKMIPSAATPVQGRTLVLATDTGITAALGLVRGQRFAPLLPRTRLIWLRTSSSYFLPDEHVRRLVPPGIGALEFCSVPPPVHPERLGQVKAVVGDDLAPGRVQQVFFTGDGAVNYALLDHFIALGLPVTRDNVDSFFNYPKKTEAPVEAAPPEARPSAP
jgi:ferredoxin-NADP reductase